MKSILILLMMTIFIASSLPVEAQIDRAVGHLFQKIKGDKRHRKLRKLHRKNIKERRKQTPVAYF